MKTLRVNDKVCLINHNPEIIGKIMTVTDVSYSTNKVVCSWVNDDRKIEKGFFNSNSLRKVSLNRHKPIEKI